MPKGGFFTMATVCFPQTPERCRNLFLGLAISLPITIEYALLVDISSLITLAAFDSMLILGLYVNRKGNMQFAAVLYLFNILMSTCLNLLLATEAHSFGVLWEWITLAIPSLLAGFFLPIWTPFLLSLVESILVTGIFLSLQQRGLLIHLPNIESFFAYIYAMLGAFAAVGALFAYSVDRAVAQADRAHELEQAYTQLEEIATKDPITSLYNHRSLHTKLESLIEYALADSRAIGVLFMDIDHFKHINDTWGHQIGDSILAHVATILRDHSRAEDIVARYGGEEFVFVVPNKSYREVQEVAERLRTAIGTTPYSDGEGQIIQPTISIGCSLFPDDGMSLKELLFAADTAMYQAKRTGRNKVCIAKEHVQEVKAA